MAGHGGYCCKCIFTALSVTFKGVGLGFWSFGGWLNKNAIIFEEDFLFKTFVAILIIQGALMFGMGGLGLYHVRTKEGISLKVFSIVQAVLALVDVITGVVLYFKCGELREIVMEIYTTDYAQYQKGNSSDHDHLIVIHNLLFCCGNNRNETLSNLCPHSDVPNVPTCPEAITLFSDILASGVLGIFLATATLLSVALVCTILTRKKSEQDDPDYTAHLSTMF